MEPKILKDIRTALGEARKQLATVSPTRKRHYAIVVTELETAYLRACAAESPQDIGA